MKQNKCAKRKMAWAWGKVGPMYQGRGKMIVMSSDQSKV